MHAVLALACYSRLHPAYLAVQGVGARITPQLGEVLKAPPPVLPPSRIELLILVLAGLQVLQVFLNAPC